MDGRYMIIGSLVKFQLSCWRSILLGILPTCIVSLSLQTMAVTSRHSAPKVQCDQTFEILHPEDSLLDLQLKDVIIFCDTEINQSWALFENAVTHRDASW